VNAERDLAGRPHRQPEGVPVFGVVASQADEIDGHGRSAGGIFLHGRHVRGKHRCVVNRVRVDAENVRLHVPDPAVSIAHDRRGGAAGGIGHVATDAGQDLRVIAVDVLSALVKAHVLARMAVLAGSLECRGRGVVGGHVRIVTRYAVETAVPAAGQEFGPLLAVLDETTAGALDDAGVWSARTGLRQAVALSAESGTGIDERVAGARVGHVPRTRTVASLALDTGLLPGTKNAGPVVLALGIRRRPRRGAGRVADETRVFVFHTGRVVRLIRHEARRRRVGRKRQVPLGGHLVEAGCQHVTIGVDEAGLAEVAADHVGHLVPTVAGRGIGDTGMRTLARVGGCDSLDRLEYLGVSVDALRLAEARVAGATRLGADVNGPAVGPVGRVVVPVPSGVRRAPRCHKQRGHSQYGDCLQSADSTSHRCNPASDGITEVPASPLRSQSPSRARRATIHRYLHAPVYWKTRRLQGRLCD